MRSRVQLFVALFVVLGIHLALGQDAGNEKQVVESFKGYVHQHLASYEHNRRERTTRLGGGWVKQYFQPKQNSASIDVQKTASLVSPYVGTLEFQLTQHYSTLHKTRAEAEADSSFVNSRTVTHKHSYAYQDGEWVPKTRKYIGNNDTLYACDEVITVGENAGEHDINGCLEEYDKP
jgi:hypothetical protein